MQQLIILHETPGFYIVAKPAGIETVSQTGGPALLPLACAQTGEPGLRPAHRLDRDTSGAQILARTPVAEKTLIEIFRRRQIHKMYLAFVSGVPRNRKGTINRPLSEWSGGRRPVRVLRGGGLEASTGYSVVAATDAEPDGWRASLLAMSPHQGRTHQIRVHASSLGYPILGDDQYGDRTVNRSMKERFGLKRQALHSWNIRFPWNGGEIDITCPLPPDLDTLWDGLFGGGAIEPPA